MFILVPFASPPRPHASDTEVGTGRCCTLQICITYEEPQVQEISSFHKRWQTTCLTFPQRKTLTHWTSNSSTVCSFSILCYYLYFSKLLTIQKFLKRQTRTKDCQCFCSKDIQKYEESWRIASQQPEVRDIKETSHLYGRWQKDISLRRGKR